MIEIQEGGHMGCFCPSQIAVSKNCLHPFPKPFFTHFSSMLPYEVMANGYHCFFLMYKRLIFLYVDVWYREDTTASDKTTSWPGLIKAGRQKLLCFLFDEDSWICAASCAKCTEILFEIDLTRTHDARFGPPCGGFPI